MILQITTKPIPSFTYEFNTDCMGLSQEELKDTEALKEYIEAYFPRTQLIEIESITN